MPITLADAAGYSFATDGYVFRLEISPTQADRSWAPAAFAQQLVAGSGSAGIVFTLEDEDTASLNYAIAYQWMVLAQAPGASPMALIGGAAKVIDGPGIPEITPY